MVILQFPGFLASLDSIGPLHFSSFGCVLVPPALSCHHCCTAECVFLMQLCCARINGGNILFTCVD